jgi:uncharacterized protein YtpQ (UPF0354 family)
MPKERTHVVSGLKDKGFRLEQDKRDHDFLFFEHVGVTQAIYTKVSRGTSHRTIDDQLLGKMSRQLKLTRKQFNDLVDCPMSQVEYEDHLRQGGYLQD